jgi:anti-sigma-K factor RskA
MNCQSIQDLLPAFALEALDPEEIRLVQAHLKGCLDCQAALQEYQAVSDGLLLAMPLKSPPPRVRARLTASLADHKAPAVQPTRRVRPAWQFGLGLALVALLILNLTTMFQLQAMQRQQATLTEQLGVSQTALALVAYPEARTFDVTGDQVAGTLVLDSELKTGVLFAWGLAPLDSAHTYQVWLIQPDGHRVSGGLFRAESGQAFASAVIRPLRPFSDFTGLGVTIEPSNGSPSPTGPKVLGVTF